MKLSLTAAAMLAASLPAAPALAHCGSHHKAVHRTTVHRVAWRAPVRRAGCGCTATRVAYRETFVPPPPPPLYRPPVTRIVYVERPFYRPLYRPIVYRPRPIYFRTARWGYRHAYRGGWAGYPRRAWR